jgi:hypothetical protein
VASGSGLCPAMAKQFLILLLVTPLTVAFSADKSCNNIFAEKLVADLGASAFGIRESAQNQILRSPHLDAGANAGQCLRI